MAEPGWKSSEREFYLAEFRGRTLGVALARAPGGSLDALVEVVDELARNGTGCVIVSPSQALLEKLTPLVVAPAESADWVGALWRALGEGHGVGLWLPEAGDAQPFAGRCRTAALRLRLAKLVWIDDRGAIRDPEGTRVSLLDLSDAARVAELSPGGSEPERALLGEIGQLLAGGVASVSICSLEGLSDELFTYAGSGTLVTEERYLEVRLLGIDDFGAATDLIARGVDEGYLAPRSEREIESALGHGFGVFVEGRYLAGIGALVRYPDADAAEIASLYTMTRFAGEGVGGHLVRFAVQRARAEGCSRVFACTTSPRVERFFERHGFRRVEPEAIPASKWAGYPEERRAQVRCLVYADASN